MNRNKKGNVAPKATPSNSMLLKIASLEKALSKSRSRGASSGGYDLSNHQISSGPLGLSSASSSRVHKSHMIEEDEYIADINGSVGFATTGFPINPGQLSTFPWGNKIASLYEKYDYQFLEFYYRREVSEFATNGQAGKIMLSCDYDASDPPPTSKQQVLDTEPHVDGMPCIQQLVLRVDCKEIRKGPAKYVRPGTLPPNTDIKTYDAGNLYVSTYGNTNTSTIGELRVRYKCLVSVPVLEAVGQVPLLQPGSYLQVTSNLAGEAAAASNTYAPLFASATTPVVMANGIAATFASTGLITLQPGSYLIEGTDMSSSATVASTALTLKVCQVVTPSTDVVVQSSASFATTDGFSVITSLPSPFQWFSNIAPIVWNTNTFGTTLSLQAAVTYPSGSVTHQGYLKITLL
jgi:hypothetical protein